MIVLGPKKTTGVSGDLLVKGRRKHRSIPVYSVKTGFSILVHERSLKVPLKRKDISPDGKGDQRRRRRQVPTVHPPSDIVTVPTEP